MFGFTSSDKRENAIQKFCITVPDIDVEDYGKYDYLRRDNYFHKVVYSLAKQGLWKYRYYKDPTAIYSEKVDRISGYYYLTGWFQSEKYFKNIRHILLEELTLKSDSVISNDIREYLTDPECVSIHVRRGDYIKYNWDLPVEYYRKAIQTIKEKFKHPRYLVFSDDINWTRKNLNFTDDVLFVDRTYGYTDYEELILMSKCGAHVISNSTFSWWGAWLDRNEEKTVIAPAKWPSGQSVEIVPKEWIIV